MNKLTFLLPLKDRPSYTRIWLKHNIRSEYDYFVADGSIGDENEALFSEMNLPNLTYVRFPQDLSIECYVEKMLQAVCQVKTKYVMTCDNDDFMNFQGVRSCINALEEDPEAVCAGGPIYGVMQNEITLSEPRYSLPARIIDAQALHNLSGYDALEQLFKNYRYMWYSIFRSEDYKKIWHDIRQLQISNVYLIELLQAELAFCHGKYIQIKTNHYIRLENPTTSFAREGAAKDIPHVHKIYFDDEYRCQVLRISEHVAKLVGVEPTHLLNERRNYYISGVAPEASSFCTKMWGRLIRIHQILPRKLHIFFPIEFGIAFINNLGKVRRA